MDTGALVRRVGGTWASPSRRGFALEQDLERLIQDYPEVLPGVSAAALAVDQFSVPSGGSVDLVVLENVASADPPALEDLAAKLGEAASWFRRKLTG